MRQALRTADVGVQCASRCVVHDGPVRWQTRNEVPGFRKHLWLSVGVSYLRPAVSDQVRQLHLLPAKHRASMPRAEAVPSTRLATLFCHLLQARWTQFLGCIEVTANRHTSHALTCLITAFAMQSFYVHSTCRSIDLAPVPSSALRVPSPDGRRKWLIGLLLTAAGDCVSQCIDAIDGCCVVPRLMRTTH